VAYEFFLLGTIVVFSSDHLISRLRRSKAAANSFMYFSAAGYLGLGLLAIRASSAKWGGNSLRISSLRQFPSIPFNSISHDQKSQIGYSGKNESHQLISPIHQVVGRHKMLLGNRKPPALLFTKPASGKLYEKYPEKQNGKVNDRGP
jgi:hypothetical protein